MKNNYLVRLSTNNPLWAFIFFLSPILLVGQALIVNVSSPSSVSICGPVVPLTIEVINSSGMNATGVTGELNLPTGVTLLSVDPASFLSGGTTIDLGNIPDGSNVSFMANIQASCDFMGGNFDYSFEITSGGTGMATSGTVQAISADISLPSTVPSVFGAYLGRVSTVTPRVVNNGFGSVEEVTYCIVNDLPNLALQGITVGGVDITAGGPAYVSGNQNCYTITSAMLDAEGLGPTLDRGESVFPVETWEVIQCVNNPRDITRRAHFGCQGDDDCRDKPAGDFTSTGVRYDLLVPDIDAAVVTSTRPACYTDDPSVVTIRLTNNGTAAARNIRTRIFVSNGRTMTVDVSSIGVTYESDNSTFSGTTVDILNNNTNPCLSGTPRDVRLNIDGVDLEVGESILLTYALTTDCSCNNCDIRNKYIHTFRLEGYDDLCNEDYNDRQDIEPNDRFDAFIEGFPEGPTTLTDAETGCVTYFVTNMQLDWLTSSYPDAYLEAVFDIGCGLDFVPNSFVFTDRDGTTFNVPMSDINVTGGANDSDILTVTMRPTGRPGGFSYAGGATFEFCVAADCSEKPTPVCGSPHFDVPLTAQFNFTTDPSCSAPCAIQKIWDPADLIARVACTNTDPNCECDGITFANLVAQRTNYGIGDSNNDQIPDGILNLNAVE
ncbi:MAG: hypothetical protein AAGJ82_09290, partial [Bacteroidota bacterium]